VLKVSNITGEETKALALSTATTQREEIHVTWCKGDCENAEYKITLKNNYTTTSL